MIRLWAVPTPQASSAAAVGQDTGGNLILTSGYGGDIFLNDIPVVSQSTDAVLPVMTKFLGCNGIDNCECKRRVRVWVKAGGSFGV